MSPQEAAASHHSEKVTAEVVPGIVQAPARSGPAAAGEYGAESVTLYTYEIKPTDDGYDLSPLKEMLAWRDARQ